MHLVLYWIVTDTPNKDLFILNFVNAFEKKKASSYSCYSDAKNNSPQYVEGVDD